MSCFKHKYAEGYISFNSNTLIPLYSNISLLHKSDYIYKT